MNELITCAASLSIGLILGIIGAGGSILTIPVFVYILKMDPLPSSIYSMFVVGICGLTGGIKSIFNKLVDFKLTILFGIPSIIGVLIARKLIFPSIPLQLITIGDFVLTRNILFMLCFSVLMLISGFRMLMVSSGKDKTPDDHTGRNPGWLFLQGLFVGVITGLLGIGGGFLIVPALYFWGRVDMKTAIGTTLIIIAMNSLFSFATSYSNAIIDWSILIKFSLGSILGILIGTFLSDKIQGYQLKKIFGCFVLTLSVVIMYNQFFL